MSVRRKPSPTLALALGGGGARGLAHIVVLEALDELGLRPAAIAGTSIGAIVGAAYAAGMSGRAIREHVLAETRDRASVIAKLLQARVGKLADLFSRNPGNPVLIDAERFLDRFWPKAVPDSFEELEIPFLAIAADFHARREIAFEKGPLVTAVAASMAVPGLVRPVEADGRVLVDGGVVDPLPFDRLAGRANIVLAVDVIGGPDENDRRVPDPFEAMFGASQLMMQAIVTAKLASHRPDILVRPAVSGFRLLDFFRAKEVLAAAEPVREEVRRALALRKALPRDKAARPGVS